MLYKSGGYRNLKSYQVATIIYDLTIKFTKQYIDKFSRTKDQMEQAARSGKQNIVEGSKTSGTSKKSEIRLVSVARSSLEELLNDYEDFLRQKSLPIWDKDDPRSKKIRQLAYSSNQSYQTYLPYLRNPESAANCLICLIHQANYLLDRQLESLEKAFIEQGGYSENLFKKRLDQRNKLD